MHGRMANARAGCGRSPSPLGDLLDFLDFELIRVTPAAHTDLLGCHRLWLEDVYERLAGSD